MKDLNTYWKENITGKRIVITGGSTGIGREITLLLTSLGANCIICGRNVQPLEETVAEVKQRSDHANCVGVVADLSKVEDIEKLFNIADEHLGGLDVLINNAAIGYGGVTEGTYSEWDYIVKTNLTAYLACSNYAAKRFDLSRKGHIVNIGSMSADVRESGSSVYVATKAGIQGFSEALRKELNPRNIKVSLIEPGAVDTDMQPGDKEEKDQKITAQEMLPAQDIAMAVAFCLLQSDRCDIVNMQIRPHLQII